MAILVQREISQSDSASAQSSKEQRSSRHILTAPSFPHVPSHRARIAPAHRARPGPRALLGGSCSDPSCVIRSGSEEKLHHDGAGRHRRRLRLLLRRRRCRRRSLPGYRHQRRRPRRVRAVRDVHAGRLHRRYGGARRQRGSQVRVGRVGEGRARERIRRDPRPRGRRRLRKGCRERVHNPGRPHPRARQGHVLQGQGLRRPRGGPAVQRRGALRGHPPKVPDGPHVQGGRQEVHGGRDVLVRRRRGPDTVLPVRGGREGISRALAPRVRRARSGSFGEEGSPEADNAGADNVGAKQEKKKGFFAGLFGRGSTQEPKTRTPRRTRRRR